MKEIRDIKIDLLMGNQNPIADLFLEITKDLRILNCNVYNEDGMEFIYYNKENQWIFFQDAKNDKFWAHYGRYWELFDSKLQLGYNEIQALTKFLVEEMLKREVATPKDTQITNQIKVEEMLKREVTTETVQILNHNLVVEEMLKREVANS